MSQDPSSLPPVQYAGGYQTPIPPPKKQSYKALWIILSLFVLCACGGLGGVVWYATHSGVVVNGKELTRPQVSDAAREIRKMLEGTVVNNEKTYDLSIEATNPLSEKFKACLSEVVQTEANTDLTGKGDKVDKLIGGSLASKEQRLAARQAIDDLDKTTLAYFDSEIGIFEELQSFWQSTLQTGEAVADQPITRLSKLKDGYINLSQKRIRIIEFLNAHPPASDSGGTVLFEKDKDVKDYTVILKEFNDSVATYQKIYKSLDMTTKDDFQVALDVLESRT